MNYTIEEVLDHTIDWVNKMIQIIAKEEFNRNIFELSLHGVPKEETDKMKSKFDGQFTDKLITKENSKLEKMKLQGFGFHFGKKSKTKVVNR